MQTEAGLSRSLWAILLTVLTIVVVFSFARHPLSGDDEAAGFSSPHLTLWVAGDAGAQMTAIAAQATSCWQLGGVNTIGLLPGSSSLAVSDFLHSASGKKQDLLLITSSTIADIARDRGNPALPEEPRELAREAEALLQQAAPIAVLASDPLKLVVPAHSPIRSGAQLLALLRDPPPGPLFAVSADPWLRGNLAALVARSDLSGDLPYEVFPSSREALAGLQAGSSEVGVATQSAVRSDLLAGRLREVPWPAADGPGPEAWVAVLAPPGLGGRQLSSLRAQARTNCGGGAWTRLLHGEGLAAPTTPPRRGLLATFVRASMPAARRDQALANRLIRAYD